jgi:hypothetical protein
MAEKAMSNDEHVSRLKRILDDRTAERRVAAAPYSVAANPLDVVTKIVLLQTEIDAIDRAIADEEQLEKSKND